jgi:hypothetical protein
VETPLPSITAHNGFQLAAAWAIVDIYGYSAKVPGCLTWRTRLTSFSFRYASQELVRACPSSHADCRQ